MYQWVDGSDTLSFNSWYTAEPLPNKTCAVIGEFRGSIYWYSRACDDTVQVFCEKGKVNLSCTMRISQVLMDICFFYFCRNATVSDLRVQRE